ncbi:MAG: ferritin-like domain-containing protein [Gemmatimonadaceae bacterium]
MPDADKTLVLETTAQLWDPRSRRNFLKLMGVGGTMVLLPSMLASCDDGGVPVQPGGPGGGPGVIGGPGTGSTVTIDFAKGDIAVLQFAYALEQLEADFYVRVANGFGASGLSAAEQMIFTDIRNHEVIHREALRTILGTANGFTLTPVYPNVNFSSRASILGTAKTFEDLGVAAYNGAAQYLTNAANLTVAGKIVSVEARHAAAIADLIAPKTTAFSLTPFDDAFSPQKVAGAAQGFIVNKLAFAGTIPAFVQGPNNNG